MSKLFRVLICTIAFFLSCTAASAQLATASLFGNVTDSTGAVIPNADITLTQTATNFSRTLKGKADGSYRADFLPVGPYTIKVSTPGFKDLVREGIVLTVTQEAHLDLALQVGGAADVVEVTAQVPLVNTGNSTLGRTIDNVEIDNLPLVNRDVYRLLSLTPGVQGNAPMNLLGFPEQHVYINGSTDGTVGQVTYYLDGGLNMTGLRNTGNVLPNPDAIDQLSVETNNFNAQFGRTSAGIVTVLTKSGTNQVHGSIFEFYRSKGFNATAHGSPSKAEYVQHNFGATVGGPLRKDKTFFFGTYQGFRFNTSQQLTAQVPDAAQRSGNFQENLATDITSCTQSPTAADVKALKFLVCSPTTRKPYLNNIITDPLDPATQAILAANVPLPNPSGLSTDTPYTLNTVQPTSQHSDQFLIKIDHQLTKSHRLTVDYFQPNGNNTVLPSGASIANWSTAAYTYRQQNANVNDVWTVSPRTVNQLYLNYTRQIAGRTNLPAKSLANFGSAFNIQGPPQLPQMAVSGWFTLAQAISGPLAGTNVYGVRDVVSTTFGKHTFFFGGEGALEKDALQTLLNDYGVFAFANSTSARTGNALSDFVMGRPNTMNQDSPVYSNANYYNYGFFAQDDWRVMPRLTLNLGVRYDVQTAPTDTQNRQLNFDFSQQSGVVPSAPRGLLFPGDPGVPRTGATTPYNHVSPRLGFALDAFGDGHTIVHGASGLFFGTISGNEFEYPSNNLPYAVRAQYTHVVSVANPYATDTTDFPGGVSPYPYFYSPAAPRFIKGVALVAFDRNYRWPYNYQINFGVQQQFGKDVALSINYVGSLNRKLPLYIEENYPIFNTATPAANTTATANARRPFNIATGSTASPIYSNVYVIQSGQTSNYNGLQVSLEKRLSRNFSVKGFYTWSKTLASAAQDNNSLQNNLEDYTNPQLDRQRSDYDIREQSVISAVWKPNYFPGHPLLHSTVDGWTLTTIVSVQSGQPFNITTGADNNGDGNTNDRPNVNVGRFARVTDNGGSRTAMTAQWFDPTIFCGYAVATPASCPGVGPAGSDGTVRPNLLDGPGVRDIDLSIFRDFGIYERFKFQVRGEATNVFNLVNLGQPTGTLSSANAGKILGANSSSTFGPRIIQIGGRILF